jgi:hypothetical protein
MAGSKKGERRGGKRAGTGQMSAPKAPKVKLPTGGNNGVKRGPARATEQYYRDITKAINGTTAKDREPRELMLKTMRYFEGLGDEQVAMATWLRDKLRTLKPSEFKDWDEQLFVVERQIREYFLLATDVAYKCAPYCHSRLSAIQVTGPNQGPLEVVGMMLEEIDILNRGRPTWAPPELKVVGGNG